MCTALAGCTWGDPYEEQAERFSVQVNHLVSDDGEHSYLSSDNPADYLGILQTELSAINQFIADNQIDATAHKDSQTPSVRTILSLRQELSSRIVSTLETIREQRFAHNRSILSRGHVIWEDGMRHHLLSGEPNINEAIILYGGMVTRRCDLLAAYLESEFPAENAFTNLRRGYDFLLESAPSNYTIRVAFDVKLGDYDFENEAFAVKSVFASNKSGALTFNAQQDGGDLIVTRSETSRCQFNDPNAEKDGIRAPQNLTIEYRLELLNTADALSQAVAIDPNEAEQLAEQYQRSGIRPRSVMAMAYFDVPTWSSRGRLAEGTVQVSGQAQLLHIEYYAYPRQFRGALNGQPYFESSMLINTDNQPGGMFEADDLIEISGDRLPLVEPISQRSIN